MIRRSSVDRRRNFGRRIARDRRREQGTVPAESRSGTERRAARARGTRLDRRSGSDRRAA
jgi:hypothetical protein